MTDAYTLDTALLQSMYNDGLPFCVYYPQSGVGIRTKGPELIDLIANLQKHNPIANITYYRHGTVGYWEIYPTSNK